MRAGFIEIKHDGFSALLRIDHGDVHALSRGGHEWSDKYGRIIEPYSNAMRSCSSRGGLLIDASSVGQLIVENSDFKWARATRAKFYAQE